MSDRKVTYGSKWIYTLLILLSVCGTAISVWNLVKTFQGPLTVLGVLSALIQFLAFLAMLIYVRFTFRIKSHASFLGVAFAYAALLGIQLLQSGQAIADFGLSKELTLMINIFNLVAFANVLMFANKPDQKKAASGYIAAAALLKLAGELILIIKMSQFINFSVILFSLSVPVLGLLILLAYLVFYREINA